MSQAWIKIETITLDKIEIARVATALGMDRYAVFGRLVRIWTYWDQHSTTGRIAGIDAAFLDAMVGHPGFCAQLVAVGWMRIDADGITLPHFERHNGETAKKRALGARRTGKSRGKRDKDQRYHCNADGNAQALREALPEKRGEEESREDSSHHGEGAAGNLLAPQNTHPTAIAIELAQEFAFLGGEGTSMAAVNRARVVMADLLAAGVTVEAIRAELKTPNRLKSEHPGRFRDRLTPKPRGHANERADAANFDPGRDYPAASSKGDDDAGSQSDARQEPA